MIRKYRLRREGTLIICVLVCMGVATTIMGLSMTSAIRAQRAVKKTQQLRQTEYLLDAGVLRSAQQLKRSIDYRGETWKPTTETINHLNPTVIISVEKQNNSSQFRVSVTATLGVNGKMKPANQILMTKRTYEFKYSLDQTQQTN